MFLFSEETTYLHVFTIENFHNSFIFQSDIRIFSVFFHMINLLAK